MARRTKEAIQRDLTSKWILFMDNGFALYTLCTQCGEIKYCRGRQRDSVKCEECYFGQYLNV